jgi:hypothetical protein
MVSSLQWLSQGKPEYNSLCQCLNTHSGITTMSPDIKKAMNKA